MSWELFTNISVYIYSRSDGYMGKSDDDLITLCVRGDISAFDFIVERYKIPLFNFIYRYIMDYETAEDLTQEVFLRVYKNIKNYKAEKSHFRTWIYKIASNLCKNELRDRKRRSKVLIDNVNLEYEDEQNIIQNVQDDSELSLQALENDELKRIISRSISDLPEKFKIVLILRDMQCLPYEEISRIINKPIGTVKSRLNRARLMLREKVRNYL